MQTQKRSFRDEHTELFEQIELWGTFILANLLWAILSIPLVTMPAATAGLFAVMSRQVQGKKPELFQVFFSAMREYWRKALTIVVIDLILACLIIANIQIFSIMGSMDPIAFLSRSITLFAALFALVTNLYAWSLLVVIDVPLRELLVLAVKLVFAYPLQSFGILIAAIIPVIISLLLPQGMFALFTGSVTVYIITWGTWRVIRKHITETV
jgi:uncharacterized membrane protein YesL